MDIKVAPVRTDKDLKDFLKLPWKIYKGNKNWVPPLINDIKSSIDIKTNKALERISHDKFLAYVDGKPAGRLFVGIDNVLNAKKQSSSGYFSLFECVECYEVAERLLDTAVGWLTAKDVELVRGPVSVTGSDGDDYKGLLIDCFDRPPVLMNSYNPPYYKDFLEKFGFERDYDLFAYYINPKKLFLRDPSKAIEYAMKKFNFRVDTLDLKNIDNEVKSIKHVLDLAVPDEWPDLIAPSLEEVYEMANKFIPVAEPSIIIIARSGDEAIGFCLALPDYNQVLIHLNGRITPLAALKYLWYKRKITSARMFIMFVVPEFRKKGVSYAMLHQAFLNGMKKGYTWGEGSTIGETNERMRNDIESIGGERYKTYRVYGKKLR